MLTWVIQRAKERTTWLGLITLLTAAGVHLEPELSELLVTAAVTLAGIVAIVTKDEPKAEAIAKTLEKDV